MLSTVQISPAQVAWVPLGTWRIYVRWRLHGMHEASASHVALALPTLCDTLLQEANE
jgi:hypothetical protein